MIWRFFSRGFMRFAVAGDKNLRSRELIDGVGWRMNNLRSLVYFRGCRLCLGLKTFSGINISKCFLQTQTWRSRKIIERFRWRILGKKAIEESPFPLCRLSKLARCEWKSFIDLNGEKEANMEMKLSWDSISTKKGDLNKIGEEKDFRLKEDIKAKRDVVVLACGKPLSEIESMPFNGIANSFEAK